MLCLDRMRKPPVLLSLTNWVITIGLVAHLLDQHFLGRRARATPTATGEEATHLPVDQMLHVLLALTPAVVLLTKYDILPLSSTSVPTRTAAL
jgi:hypothetical protein